MVDIKKDRILSCPLSDLKLFEVSVVQTQECFTVSSFVTSHLLNRFATLAIAGGKALIYKAFLTLSIQDTLPKVNGNPCEPVSQEHTGGQKEWHRHRI